MNEYAYASIEYIIKRENVVKKVYNIDIQVIEQLKELSHESHKAAAFIFICLPFSSFTPS